MVRIRTRGDADLAAIRDELEGIGFAAEQAANAMAAVRWYGPSAVGELCREEGMVIAARVVPVFGAATDLRPEQIEALTTRVAAAPYEWFIEHPDAALVAGGLASSCGRAVSAATSVLLGPGCAAALAQTIKTDLTGTPGRQ